MKKSFDYTVKYIVGENDRGVYFNRSDIFTVLFLYEQRTVSQIQLRKFYELISGEPISRTTFSSKLTKWAKMKLIKKENISVRKKRGFTLDFVSISSKGVKILYRLKLISDCSTSFVTKRQYEHNIAITQFVLNLLEAESQNEHTGAIVGGKGDYLFPLNSIVKQNLHLPNLMYSNSNDAYFLYEDEEYREMFQPELQPVSFLPDLPQLVYSFRPSKEFYPDSKGNPLIIPDWVITCNNSIINIEVDTGSENIPFLENKLKKYLDIAAASPSKQYYVLFSVIDDSYHTISTYKKRTTRVTNLKKSFSNIPRLCVVDNLNVYVCNMGGAALVVNNILQEIRKTNSLSKNHLLKKITERLNINSSFPYSVEWISNKNEMQTKGIQHSKLLELTDDILVLRKKSSDEEKNSLDYLEILCISTILKVGEVNAHFKLQQLSGLLAMQNQYRTLNPIKILGIYEADELERGQQAIFTDLFHNSIAQENILLATSAELLNFTAAFYSLKERVKHEFGECSSKEC
ncbi:replication-relaxation family protein [Bacillus thuringiensis]|uniref:replication-relaxation family protein n=1 Tax=Bacillus thuringiensis TaxID=1428 RepID=UPI001CCEE0EA|nr:replication-relaxation family protein [Bacillus thuringiensis]MBZ8123294.1 hypothetical protein [Bacillus thuringiensis]